MLDSQKTCIVRKKYTTNYNLAKQIINQAALFKMKEDNLFQGTKKQPKVDRNWKRQTLEKREYIR